MYGAAGGNQVSNGYYGHDSQGGKGGYSIGYVTLNKDQVLYVYVGGKGEDVSNQIVNQRGGYNGGAGGSSYSDTTSNDEWTEINNNTIYIAPGGGATHIATANRGTLNTYYSNRDDLLMVAGGGGGAIYSYCSGKTYSQSGSTFENWIDPGYGNGGAGGGVISNPTLTNVRNWTGSGEYGFATGLNGGGAGYKSGYNSAGGTGYIAENVNNGLMESNVRIGDGYAKITLVEVVSFTVNYDANTGLGETESTISGPQDINGNALVTLAQNNFTKDGYTFDSWNTMADGSGDRYPAGGEILVSENTTLYANWVPTTYDINYVLNGGEVITSNPVSYDIETENFILNNPSKVGYKFLGWTGSNGEEPELTVRVEKGTFGDLEFVANWEANTDTPYIVRHWLQKQNSNPNVYTEDNYEQKAIGRYSGVSDDTITPAVNTYIGFTSPTPQEYTLSADGSLIVDYYYPRNRYTFTLGECEGVDLTQSAQSGTYYYEDVITLKATVNEGYTWVGWSNGEEENTINVTFNLSDIVIYPIATKNEYTIEYLANEIGTNTTVFSEENPNVYTVTTESFTLADPTKEGYEFLGWTWEEQQDPVKEVTILKGSTGNRIFTANWIPEGNTSYKVNHLLQKLDGDAEILDEENYTKVYTDELIGQSDSLVTPAVKEYEGFTAPEPIEVSILPNGNQVVNYYYIRNKYLLTVEEAEGLDLEGTTANGEYYFENNIGVSATILDGYTFVNWLDVEAEEEIEFKDFIFTMPSRSVTLIPNVTKNIYLIEYVLAGGVVEDAKTSYTVTDEDYTLPTPVRAGYVFTGWTWEGQQDPVKEVIIPSGSMGDIEFTANWILDEHTSYKVEHYLQKEDLDGYDLYGTENKEGITLDTAIAEPLVITGFKVDLTNENNIVTGQIKEDGSLILKLYYTRKIYAVTLILDDGEVQEGNVTAYIYGVETVLPKNVVKEGYTFKGWYDNGDFEGETIEKILQGEAGEKTYYAKWEEEENPLIITSEVYEINEQFDFISGVEIGTTVGQFTKKVTVNRDVRVLDKNGNELGEDAILATGYTLEIKVDEENVKTFEILVLGDISGNGKIGIEDLTTLNQFLLGLIPCDARKETVYLKTLDINKNGFLTISDLTTINQIILGIN